MGITRIGYNGFVVATAILMVREGVYVEAAGAFLVVAFAGKWAYRRLTRTEPPPTSDTLLGTHEAPPPPVSEDLPKTEWITKRELGILAAVALVGGILYLTRDKGGFIHVVGGKVRVSVDFKDPEPLHQVGRHFTFPIPSGPHRVGVWDAEVGGSSRYFQVDVHEGEAFMLSAGPDPCIVQVDMGTLKYGQPLRPDSLPVQARFLKPWTPVLIPPNAFLGVAELPDIRPEGASPSLLTPIPCTQAQDDRSAWAAVRASLPVVQEWAQRAGYSDTDPTRGEAQAREAPP